MLAREGTRAERKAKTARGVEEEARKGELPQGGFLGNAGYIL